MSEASAEEPQGQAEVPAISEIAVSGFKSIRDECRIAIRPLTILAGANSSGKSSIMQPLLLMKQTINATTEPNGDLLLNGPNVRFRAPSEAVWARGRPGETASFRVEVTVEDEAPPELPDFEYGERVDYIIKSQFDTTPVGRFVAASTYYRYPEFEGEVRLDMQAEELSHLRVEGLDPLHGHWFLSDHLGPDLEVRQRKQRCFLVLEDCWQDQHGLRQQDLVISPSVVQTELGRLIHVPGLRDNPHRSYEPAGATDSFPGLFHAYAASLVADWLEQKDPRISVLEGWLRELSLTSAVRARRIDAASIELQVSRTAGHRFDLVSIADVGIGVSQVLPVLVALLAAEPGQLVYIEQPELHLHPKAQLALAGILVEAAKRGIRAVIETHSDLLLTGIQTQVAEGKLPPEDVILHWFTRDDEGVTHVSTAEIDEAGRYGDWPEDFGDVSLRAHSDYLDASQARRRSHRRAE